MSSMDEEMIAVRACVHLPGLRAGEWALVDPNDEYIIECLHAGWIVADEEHS